MSVFKKLVEIFQSGPVLLLSKRRTLPPTEPGGNKICPYRNSTSLHASVLSALPSGKSRDDSLKNKVIGLKKSLSYDHVCDQDEETVSQTGSTAGDKMTPVGAGGEGSLLGSLIGRRHAKKQLEPAAAPPRLEPAESTESVPLFWKSASAHNLTHEKKPVHLRTSIMQKSLSVIASAKEKMPGLTSKTQSVEDASKKGLKGQEGVTLSEVDETPEHYPKMIISQSVEYSKTPLKMGIMKQQVISFFFFTYLHSYKLIVCVSALVLRWSMDTKSFKVIYEKKNFHVWGFSAVFF